MLNVDDGRCRHRRRLLSELFLNKFKVDFQKNQKQIDSFDYSFRTWYVCRLVRQSIFLVLFLRVRARRLTDS
jgi:hypothetical protein